MISLIWVLPLFVFNINLILSDDQLVFIQTLSRHGARSPIKSFPADDYNESMWLQGYGQLTKHGMIQLKDLGKFFRLRYVEGQPHTFLSKSYNRKEIYVRSSDIDRTLMSAESCMDGLYPSTDPILPINPIPVHTIDASSDKELLNDGCEEYNVVLKEVLASEEVESLRKSYVDFFWFLSEKTWMPIESFDDVLMIADNFICKSANNFTLPSWLTMKFNTRTFFEHLILIKDSYFNFRFNRRNLAKLRSGLLLGNIINRMLKKISNETNNNTIHNNIKFLNNNTINNNTFLNASQYVAYKAPQKQEPNKAYLYFAHDTTLSGLLGTLKVFNDLCPPFATTLIIELFKYNNNTIVNNNNFDINDFINNISNNKYNVTNNINDYYVKLLYRNVTDDVTREPYTLTIPGCDENCPLPQFLYLTKDNVVTNWQAACLPGTRDFRDDHNKWTITLDRNHMMMVIVISCIIAFILLFIIISFFVIKCRSYKTYRKYIDLPTEIN